MVVSLKKDLSKTLSIIAQIVAYILAIIIVIQILRILDGGSWKIEEIILALVIFNLTISFSIGGYLIHLNNKISNTDKKMHGHFEWHRGKDSRKQF